MSTRAFLRSTNRMEATEELVSTFESTENRRGQGYDEAIYAWRWRYARSSALTQKHKKPIFSRSPMRWMFRRPRPSSSPPTAQVSSSARAPARRRLGRRQFVKSLTRVYDFTAGAMRDEWVRMSAETPSVGPEQQTIAIVSGNFAWNESGKNMVPQPHQVTSRAHDLVISPHGLLRAAFANSAAVSKKTIDGRPMTVISFTDQGKHKVVAYANDQNAIERVESSYGHPVVGDIKVVTYYGPYRDFAGVKFPTKIIQYQDDKPTLDLTVTAVRANPAVNIEVPANVPSTPTVAKSEKAADGVWFISGGSHNSVLIEMKDYLIVVEGAAGRSPIDRSHR